MKLHYICLPFFMALVFLFQLQADVLIPANDKRINYYGRFDLTDSLKPRFNWSGATIEASFPGPVIGMKLEHQDAYYDIEIDGKFDTVISTGNQKDFIFKKNLSPQIHTVRIRLRSENHYSAATFHGLYIANGMVLNNPPDKPLRKIEFIGDSHTAGYGVESPDRNCSNPSGMLNKTTNTNKSFAGLITQRFHAQSIIVAWSGAGMVRNYGASAKRSPDPFPTQYDKILGAVSDKKWDYSSWKPDLVVVNLGTNDYSTTPNPDDSMYIGDYHRFIDRIYSNYPGVSILCVSSGNGNTLDRNIKKIVSDEVTVRNHPNVFYAAYPNGMEYTGCDWHPSISDNVKLANVLTDTIMKKMAWDTIPPTGVSVISHYQKVFSKINGRVEKKTFKIIVNSFESASEKILLLNVRGEVLDSRIPGGNGMCSFDLNDFCSGIYFAGNNKTGWISTVFRN